MLPQSFYDSVAEDKRRNELCLQFPLHNSKHGWTTYVAKTPRGTLSNHHIILADDNKESITERVIPETAYGAYVIEVLDADHKTNSIVSVVTYRKLYVIGNHIVWVLENVSERYPFKIMNYLKFVKISKFRLT
jgi:hypothetical protein